MFMTIAFLALLLTLVLASGKCTKVVMQTIKMYQLFILWQFLTCYNISYRQRNHQAATSKSPHAQSANTSHFQGN